MRPRRQANDLHSDCSHLSEIQFVVVRLEPETPRKEGGGALNELRLSPVEASRKPTEPMG